MGTTDVLQNPATVDAYQALYDSLGRAYWDASDIGSKDLVQGAREAIYDIITELDEAQLDANTAALLALKPKIKDANEVLEKIQAGINGITRNINTASRVISGINKVLAIAAAFA
ncbi:MAG: hypothetical protein JWQ42_3859 [Edaphobacter sp.]|nr:hypothetical protein [Edaphobacter sp.]